MRISLKKHRSTLVALAIVATGIGGYSAASATGSDDRPTDVSPNTGQVRDRTADRAALVGGQTETYTGITPCRIVDTRDAGGPISSTTRDFKVSGSLTAQGGNTCGIPENATSVAVNLTAITTGGSGFFRAWAFAGAPSSATLLNYAPGLNPTNQVNIPLCRKPFGGADPCTGAKAFTIRNFGSANLVADAVGYYAPPIFALVSSTGALGQSSGVVSVARTPGKPVGNYDLTFDRDVTDCAASATDVIWDITHDVSIELGTPTARRGQVAVTRPNESYQDTWFYVTVTC